MQVTSMKHDVLSSDTMPEMLPGEGQLKTKELSGAVQFASHSVCRVSRDDGKSVPEQTLMPQEGIIGFCPRLRAVGKAGNYPQEQVKASTVLLRILFSHRRITINHRTIQ